MMNVLSLFGGIEIGRQVLKDLNIPVNKYYSSEIDKYAIAVANKNHPDIIQIGNIKRWKHWDIDLTKIDLILSGFPCQSWSIAGKQLGDKDPRGALIYDMIDIWNRIVKYNPNVKFLFENVKMKQEFIDYINNLFGVEPILINSALVSAQNRRRNYWCSWHIEQPRDKHLFLNDIIESVVVDRDKSFCIDSNYYKGGNLKQYYSKSRRQLVFEAKNGKKIEINIDKISVPCSFYETRTELGKQLRREIHQATGKDSTPRGKDHKKYVPLNSGKANCLVTVDSQLNYIIDEDWYIRKLTCIECERLQGLSDGYTEFGLNDVGELIQISNTQRYKMLGNAWQRDTIEHIFSTIDVRKQIPNKLEFE